MTTAHSFTKFAQHLTNGGENLPSATLKVALLTAYTPAVDTHEFWSDVLGAGTEVASGLGYATGGVALTGVSVAYDLTNHRRYVTASNPTWSTPGLTCRYAVFYDFTSGANATSPVMIYWDFGSSVIIAGLIIDPTGFFDLKGTG